MARIKPSEKKPDEKAITPKPLPIPKQPPKAKSQGTIKPKNAPEPTPEKAIEQPKRRTIQDRRPALKELQEPVERKIVTKPIYTEKAGVVTKNISETKDVVVRPTGTVRPGALTPTPVEQKKEPLPGRGLGRRAITEARLQQERAIDEARAAYTARQREDVDAALAFERKKREQEEASYRLSLGNQGRYVRKR